MMAFTILYLQEPFVGTGILTQYGLPYDEVLSSPPLWLHPWPCWPCLGILVTGAAGFGLIGSTTSSAASRHPRLQGRE